MQLFKMHNTHVLVLIEKLSSIQRFNACVCFAGGQDGCDMIVTLYVVHRCVFTRRFADVVCFIEKKTNRVRNRRIMRILMPQ